MSRESEDTRVQAGRGEIDRLVTDAVGRIEEEARRVEIDTRIAIQEKSKKWATASVGLFLFAFGLLALFGVREVVNLRSEASRLEKDARAAVAGLERRASEMSAEIDAERGRFLTELAEFRGQLEKVRLDFEERRTLIDDIDVSVSKATAALNQASGLNDAYVDVKAQLDNIEKLQNSFFNVYVMYPGERGDIQQLLTALRNAGYIVLPENILNVSVDQTELIYYDDTEPKQVEEVRAILESVMTSAGRTLTVRARYVTRNAPRDLLVKVQRD